MIRTAALILLAAAALPVAAAERRCGWLLNPTPANWWLRDRDGEWTIGEQGIYEAPGADMPDMAHREYVETNGHYGYGCACMTVVTDRATRRVTRVIDARQMKLARCRTDRSLPRPN